MTAWDVVLIAAALLLALAHFLLVDERRQHERRRAEDVEMALGGDPLAGYREAIVRAMKAEIDRKLKKELGRLQSGPR